MRMALSDWVIMQWEIDELLCGVYVPHTHVSTGGRANVSSDSREEEMDCRLLFLLLLLLL